jgi:hypothetical protein
VNLHSCVCSVNCDRSLHYRHYSDQVQSALHPRQNLAYLLITLNILSFPTIYTSCKTLNSIKWSLPCKVGSYLSNQFASFHATWNYITMLVRAFHWTVSWARWIHSTPSRSVYRIHFLTMPRSTKWVIPCLQVFRRYSCYEKWLLALSYPFVHPSVRLEQHDSRRTAFSNISYWEFLLNFVDLFLFC